jgi:anti-sigma B factor antagonist
MKTYTTNVTKEIVKVEVGTEFDSETKVMSGHFELDIENQARFVKTINQIINRGKSKIILDMRYVTYIDSSGLWAIFEGHKKAIQNNGQLIILKPTKDVRRVLEITKMSSKVKIVPTEEIAISLLNK